MSKDNVERFNRLAGSIFAKLYESFPVPIRLSASDFHKEIFDSDQSDKEQRSDQNLNADAFFRATVNWLTEAGYLTNKGGPLTGDKFNECVLTAKALEVLKTKPKNIVGAESLGKQLADAVKEGAVSKIKELTSETLSKGLGAIFSAGMLMFGGS